MSVAEPKFQTNIVGKVRNTKLSKTKPLWPLFEAISNSIHSIEESPNTIGKIVIEIVRIGSTEALAALTDIEQYAIKSFIITDNGVGFTGNNFNSFLTAESDYKIEKGAKGIGRFVCLKAFQNVTVDSIYKNSGTTFLRKFDFKAVDSGIFNYVDEPFSGARADTSISLLDFKEEYQENCVKTLEALGQNIIEHFLVYFILKKCPEIILIDSNKKELNLKDLYQEKINPTILTAEFKARDKEFSLHFLKLYHINESKHSIQYCANERVVDEDNLGKYIADLGKRIKESESKSYVYQAYITGKYLDLNVNSERTDFTFPKGDGEDVHYTETTKKEIREKGIEEIEKLIGEYLTNIRKTKLESFKEYISTSAPEYAPIVKYKLDDLNKLAPDLKGNKLNIELFKIQSEWELDVKKKGEEFLKLKNDATDTEYYKQQYETYIEQFNEVGKSNLAKYIVHRKAIINLLSNYLEVQEDGKFMREDAIHNIIFPIKKESDEIGFDKQNLWLIDERLAYHKYLASDLTFKNVKVIDSTSEDRTDLLIFNDSFAFVNDEAPHQSFVIIEFKKPQRADYVDTDEKKNPIDQVTSYIQTIRESKATDRTGRLISIDKDRTPFYVYIVCDFNPKLISILDTRNYKKTPDAMGYFYYHDTYNAYIEVISYEKLLKDAKNRNRMLFEKLGLPD